MILVVSIPSFSFESNDLEEDSTYLNLRYGGYANLGLNIHSSDFKQLPGIPNCCTGYKGGFGFGFSIGGQVIKPLTQDISLYGRLGFNLLSSNFNESEPFFPIIDGVPVNGIFEHDLQVNLSAFELSLLGSYRLIDELSAIGGLLISGSVGQSYSQVERIVEPSDRGTFSDGTREHNKFEGSIPELNSLNLGITLGLTYSLPLNRKKTLFLHPEISYSYYLMPVVSDLDWNINTLRVGASVFYKEPPPPPPPPPPPMDPPDPMIADFPLPPTISASVAVIQIDSNNVEMNDFNIHIEDFISLNLRPLLNYVFFDEDSSTIPNRYFKLTGDDIIDFNNDDLENLGVLQTYYHLLNIIGRRLRDNNEYTIELVGNNSNTNNEKDNKELSLNRALNVRNYLRDVWKIDEKRMKVTARNLPKECSDKTSPEGQAENRRVEILSKNNDLLQPVITTDTIRQFHDYRLRFFPSVRATAGLKKWNLTIKQGNKTLKQFTDAKSIPDSLDWFITQNDSSAPKQGGQIFYSISAEDSIGQRTSSPVNWIPVDQLTIEQKRISNLADKEYEYFSLILFNFGKSKLDKKHKSVLKFVKSRIKPESNISIAGFTDQSGDEKINEKISLKRASEAKKQLELKNVTVNGVGESELLYDNLLPEGRFYCRTVKITIENPIQNNK